MKKLLSSSPSRKSALNIFRVASVCLINTKQMDAEGLGRKLLPTPSSDPRRAPEKQTVGTVTASHKMLTLQALSSSLIAGTARGGCLGQGEAFGCPPAVCPPNGRDDPRPFAHYRLDSLERERKKKERRGKKMVGLPFFVGISAPKKNI